MNYRDTWDLTTIPDDAWAKELGRRMRTHAPRSPRPESLKLCGGGCKTFLNARQRRKPCPTCNTRNDDRKVTK